MQFALLSEALSPQQKMLVKQAPIDPRDVFSRRGNWLQKVVLDYDELVWSKFCICLKDMANFGGNKGPALWHRGTFPVR